MADSEVVEEQPLVPVENDEVLGQDLKRWRQ